MVEETSVLFCVNLKSRRCSIKDFPEVVAIFPEVPESTPDGLALQSYTHAGWFGAVSRSWLRDARNATEKEYSGLKKELEEKGFNLKVCDKITSKHNRAYLLADRGLFG